MMLRHPGERGIAVDHWAALVFDGGNYSVVSVADKPGSVPQLDGPNVPGVWIKEVHENQVVSTPLPSKGSLDDLLKPATTIVQDSRIGELRAANPAV